MSHALLPFRVFPSRPAAHVLGNDIAKVAVFALRSALKRARSIEIAHQQIVWCTRDGVSRHIAFSTRIGSDGDVVIELDLGDPGLKDHIVLESDLREAAKSARAVAVKGTARDARSRSR